ncbi:hypothetical protein AVEN_105161-1 [Araneus ventricosus]|uniref:Uncharacterized protein n=1 Tax=Araneus ventricosus TaxID=182803 RepID=A0A4Y1ZQ41_ARAVE|nr:hypothetical protein AVEN_105161-1 [Araneus ventricosus]
MFSSESVIESQHIRKNRGAKKSSLRSRARWTAQKFVLCRPTIPGDAETGNRNAHCAKRRVAPVPRARWTAQKFVLCRPTIPGDAETGNRNAHCAKRAPVHTGLSLLSPVLLFVPFSDGSQPSS